jgi:toxin-antitoxin system PIN domain toxin
VFVVDTNVLVYAANSAAPEQETCFRALEQWRKQPGAWYLTWGICFEFLSVITNRRLVASPWSAGAAWEFLNAIIQAPGLEMLVPSDRYADVVRDILSEMPTLRGNDMHDVEIAALMRDRGIKTIYTRDIGFRRFRLLEPIDPIAQSPYGGGLHEA